MSDDVVHPPVFGQAELGAAIHELASQATVSLLQALRHAGQGRDRRRILLAALQGLDDIASVLEVSSATRPPEQPAAEAGPAQAVPPGARPETGPAECFP